MFIHLDYSYDINQFWKRLENFEENNRWSYFSMK